MDKRNFRGSGLLDQEDGNMTSWWSGVEVDGSGSGSGRMAAAWRSKMARENSELELQARKEGRGLRTHGERGRSYPLRSSKGRGSGGAGAAQGSAGQQNEISQVAEPVLWFAAAE
jgi:hypothetical protein